MHLSSGSFKVYGAVVSGSTVNGKANNVYLPDGKVISFNGAAMTNTASVGVTMERPGIFTSGYSTYHTGAPSANFFSDDPAYGVGLDGGEAALGITVSYNGNGATGGTAPTDSTLYSVGNTVTVVGNTGNLVKTVSGTDYIFTGWTMTENGTGIVYSPDRPDKTFTIGNTAVTLYAKWELPVARIERTGGTAYYASLKDAINNAGTGEKITLLAEINQTTENPAGDSLAVIDKAVTLDLNGQVITAKGFGTVIAIDGAAVTIIDSDKTNPHTASPVTYTDPITNATVTVNGGVITGGSNSGVRIENGGSLSMSAGTIAGNWAHNYSGGVYVDYNGSFSMSGTASVSGNTAGSDGGGVYVGYNGSFSMSGSASVSGNKAGSNGGGVYFTNSSSVEMSGSASVFGNKAGINGGGVYAGGESLSMSGTASVSGNDGGYGGGVYVFNGSFSMSGSASVSGNKAAVYGGCL